MQIKSLKVYCDIVDRRSFSRAAEDNHVSQSSASQLVHQLEDRLGVRLIDRSTRPFVVTPEGERYYEGCRDLVRQYMALEREVRNLHEEVASRLHVASIYSVGLAHMSRYQREFLSRHPKADLRIAYLHPERVYDAVERGDADLGIVSFPEKSRRVGVLPWREEPMALVAAPGHPIARLGGSAPLSVIDGQVLVAFQRGLAIRDEVDRELSRRRITVLPGPEFDNIETIKQAVEEGHGVGFLPEPTVAREVAAGALVRVRLTDCQMTRPLGILFRRGSPLNGAAERFLEVLRLDAQGPAALAEAGALSEAGAMSGAGALTGVGASAPGVGANGGAAGQAPLHA